jgi:GT2 family glycosyltransferase/ADP-heptose:LPS heptosyltransferase
MQLQGNEVVIRRTGAIGDALAATVVADRVKQAGAPVIFQSHPDIHPVLRRVPSVTHVTVPEPFCHINLDGGYEQDPLRRSKHFYWMFLERAREQFRNHAHWFASVYNAKPHLRISDEEKARSVNRLEAYPKPWIFICPRSDSYNVREVPFDVWQAVAEQVEGTKFWVGTHPGPSNIVNLNCRRIEEVLLLLSVADLLISVDTGPLHLAAAMDITALAIGQSSSPELHLSDQADYQTISPKLDCLNCQLNRCPKNQWHPPCMDIDPDFIAAWANAKLRSKTYHGVSAIITIWKPDYRVLNLCLERVLPQVDEVIVTAEAGSMVPTQVRRDPRIRYVRTSKSDIGYAGNANYGARQSCHRTLLFLNDDCFLYPDAVERLKEAMTPGVGVVSCLMYYGDGRTIYHGGKARAPGMRGWGHIDCRQTRTSINTITEMENVNGAVMMIPRSIFYSVDGFDEELKLFANDDDMCLKVRKKGWKVMYTPFAKANHLEHQSVNKVGDIMTLVNGANMIFDRKWHGYFDHNINRIPGDYNYV